MPRVRPLKKKDKRQQTKKNKKKKIMQMSVKVSRSVLFREKASPDTSDGATGRWQLIRGGD